MSTLADIRLQVRWRLGNRAADLGTGDGATLLDTWINEAYRELTHSVRFHELEDGTTSVVPTAIGNRSVVLPAATYAILSVYNVTRSYLLEPFVGSFAEYERTVGTTNGRPLNWLHFSSLLYLKPPVDATDTLRLGRYIEPTVLSAAGDIPVIPPVWHKAIAIMATAAGWRALDEDERASGIESTELRSFLARVRTPIAMESRVARRRGTRVKMMIRDRNLGV